MPTQSRKTILLATDQQRSVLSALDTNRRHPIAYTPYGHHSWENGLLSLLRFNGELPDPVTGHYHLGNGYRQFNPVLMRFNSPDSWSPFGEGGLNAYGYCNGDSINRADPSGHAFVKPLIKQMTKQLSELPNHPTKKVCKYTQKLLKTSRDKLGGKSGIKKLANEKGQQAEEVLLEHVLQRIETSLTNQLSLSQSILESATPPPLRGINLERIKLNISMFGVALKDLRDGAKHFLKPNTLETINALDIKAKIRVQDIVEQRVLPKYSMFPLPPPRYEIPAPDSLPPSYYENFKIRKS